MVFRGIAVVSCAAVALCAAQPASAFGIRVTGGFAHVAYGDFNDFADGINDLIARDPDITGELGDIRWIPELGAEVTAALTPLFSLGAGAGMLRGSSEFTFSSGGATLSFEHTVAAYPFTGTLYAEIPASLGFAKPYAFAGGGAYYTKLAFAERVGSLGDVVGYDADLSSWGYGLHGGAGISVAVAPRVAVDIGFKGRYVKVSHFEGTATSTKGETIDVVLGFYEGEEGYMVYGPLNAGDYGAVDEGVVDLSGYAITLGVNISF